MVKVKTLRPLQTYNTMITPDKYPCQARTMKLHMNLCNNHHRGRVTTIQRLRSTILLPNVFRKTNLVVLEAAKTFYTPIPTLTTQKNTDIDDCKVLLQPLFVCNSYSPFLPFSRTHQSTSFLSLFWGQVHIITNHQQSNKTITNKVYKKQSHSIFKTTVHHKLYVSITIYQLTSQPYHYSVFFQYQYMALCSATTLLG